jgi:hypothetical protein
MKKGGNGPMEVKEDNIEAAIIVYAKKGEAQKFYAFNNNNMQKLNKPSELFKNFIAPYGSTDTAKKLVFKNYPIDSIGYTYDNTSHKLTISKEYNETKSGMGFNDLAALIYCLDVSAASAAPAPASAAPAPAAPATRKYMVITFLMNSQLCDNFFESDGSKPLLEINMKSGKLATSSAYDDNTEFPKNEIKKALQHIHENNSSGSKLFEYGKQLYENLI